jgi:hypothetical protein
LIPLIAAGLPADDLSDTIYILSTSGEWKLDNAPAANTTTNPPKARRKKSTLLEFNPQK